MVRTCVDLALEELSWLEKDPSFTLDLMDRIRGIQLDLRFLKMFFWSFANWNDADKYVNFGSAMSKIEARIEKAGKGLYAAGLLAIHKRRYRDWNFSFSELLEKVEQCKPEIGEMCIHLFHGSLHSWDSTSNKILEFLGAILMNLNDLVSSRADMIVPVKNQIGALEEKLNLFRNFVDFTADRCISYEELRNFRIHVLNWANKAACLSILYWIGKVEEEMEPRMNIMLSDLLQHIKPCTPEVTGMYLGVMKASKASRSDSLLMGEIVASFIDFLSENLVFPVKDCHEIFREGLIFLIALLTDPPEESKERKLIRVQRQADAVLSEAAHIISSLCCNEMNDGIVKERMTALTDFQKQIDIVKEKVRKLYCPVSRSLRYMFPMVNGLGFVDLLLRDLENVNEMLKCNSNFLPYAKHQVLLIREELVSLRPHLEDINKLQNEHGELKPLWMQIINVAFQAENAINSCSITDGPIWYNMIWLSNVLEGLKVVKSEAKKITDNQMNGIAVLSQKMVSSHIRTSQDPSSRMDEVVVGFADETETIIDRLTRGSTQLDIVSIVGMPGLGKTTLAKKVYYDRAVRYHFTKYAWSSVSQVHKSRELLLDILSDLIGTNDQIRSLMDDELAEKLYKCLKGQRYLIVLDDIWDIKAWDELKMSFPDDHNGSRIVFTTRNYNVALQAKSDSSPHHLRFLSDNESWELFQEKIFQKDGCPENLAEVGKQIAKSCKGLPLSIVVIAGLLARTEPSLNWWKAIAETTGSYVAKVGCMDILELSYKHLPEFLKSCFLYFGAFVEDKKIRVKKLVPLWIGEGFIQKSEMNSLCSTAKEYLTELVDRSLVIVTDRGSNGGIKACRIHDILRDFCISKAQQEKFLWPIHGYDTSHCSSDPMKYDQYRLCIQTKWKSFVSSKPVGPGVRSILFTDNNNWQKHPHSGSLFRSFKLLQVLDLEEVMFEKYFPDEIILLVHLRYLALNVSAVHVPSSIANLWKLEIFILKETYGGRIWFPHTVWKMKWLRHLDIGKDGIIPLGNYKLEENCQLENIETFSSAIICYGEGGEKLLRRILNVRKLSCHFKDSWDFHRKCNQLPSLDILSKLESLNVIYRGKLLYPYAFSFPSSLKKLSLSNFQLPWRAISSIAKLCNLEVLKLMTKAFVGVRCDMEDVEFSNLKFLKLHELDISQWNASSDSFPCLQRLVLEKCHDLEGIPSSVGDISTLKTIQVFECNYFTACSARKIREEQLEMGIEDLEVLTLNSEMVWPGWEKIVRNNPEVPRDWKEEYSSLY